MILFHGGYRLLVWFIQVVTYIDWVKYDCQKYLFVIAVNITQNKLIKFKRVPNFSTVLCQCFYPYLRPWDLVYESGKQLGWVFNRSYLLSTARTY